MRQQGYKKRRSMKMGMKSRIILDALMLLTLVALMLAQNVGVTVHIVLSVLFFILLVIHCRVNWKRIRASVHKAKVGRLALYLALLAFFLLAVLSGLMLSELLFGQLNATETLHWHRLHGWSTRLMLVSVVVHVLSNKKTLATFFANRMRQQDRVKT